MKGILVIAMLISVCYGQRYAAEVFPAVDSTTYIYDGVNAATMFEPSGDTSQSRACVIVIHGGGFLVGDRSDEYAKCMMFARRGFVAIAPDYSLGHTGMQDGCDTITNSVAALIRARNEIATMINGLPTGIDTGLVFVMGWSAGATLAGGLTWMTDTAANPVPNIYAALGHVELIVDIAGYSFHSSHGAGAFVDDTPGLFFVGLQDTSTPNICYNNPCFSYPYGVACSGTQLYDTAIDAGACSRYYANANAGHTAFSDSFLVDKSACFFYSVIHGICSSGADTLPGEIYTPCSGPLAGISRAPAQEEAFKVYEIGGRVIFSGGRDAYNEWIKEQTAGRVYIVRNGRKRYRLWIVE